MKKLVIFGAGGHGKVSAECAIKMGFTDIEFLDDCPKEDKVIGFPVTGRFSDAERYQKDEASFFIAIGNNPLRLSLIEKYSEMGYEVVSLIHPKAVVSAFASIDDGVLIMPGAVINAGAQIGRGAIINTGVRIDHDCVIEDGVHISPGSVLCGTVSVGALTWICAGSVIANNTSVANNCVVAAGAAVIKDVPEYTLVAGVPAVFKKYLRAREGKA